MLNTKVIAIGSGKGGVGKSSITICLAYFLKNCGFKIGILDADVYGPSLSVMLPCQYPPKECGDWLYPGRSRGIDLISISHFDLKNTVPAFRAPIVNATIEKFVHRVKWNNPDFILVDLPPGTGDIHLTLMQESSVYGSVLVTTPQNVSLVDVRKSANLFVNMGIPILGIVENMSYFTDKNGAVYKPFGQGGGEKLSEEFNTRLLGQIPVETTLCQCLDFGKSIFEGGSKDLLNIVLKVGSALLEEVNSKIIKSDIVINSLGLYQMNISCGNKQKILTYSYIQQFCPCAACKSNPKKSVEKVALVKMHKVGNYGMRFDLVNGCSYGIYSWNLLQKICLVE